MRHQIGPLGGDCVNSGNRSRGISRTESIVASFPPSPAQLNQFARAALHRCLNVSAYRIIRSLHWIIGKVSVARSCGCLGVAQQTTDYGQTEPATGAEARVGMSKIVKADSFETGTFLYCPPRAM